MFKLSMFRHCPRLEQLPVAHRRFALSTEGLKSPDSAPAPGGPQLGAWHFVGFFSTGSWTPLRSFPNGKLHECLELCVMHIGSTTSSSRRATARRRKQLGSSGSTFLDVPLAVPQVPKILTSVKNVAVVRVGQCEKSLILSFPISHFGWRPTVVVGIQPFWEFSAQLGTNWEIRQPNWEFSRRPNAQFRAES